jgi:glutamate--cysteine ligase catalytic subunit
MGLLSPDASLTWEEIQRQADYLRERGATQFLNLWRKQKDRDGDPPLWGDEVSQI